METETSKQFSKCPVCEGMGRIQIELNSEIEKGHARKDVKSMAFSTQTIIVDQHKTGLILPKNEAPAIIAMFDFCNECGCMFCIGYKKAMAKLEMKKPQQPGQFNFGSN